MGPKVFSRVLRGSEGFSRGYFVGRNVFFVGISWVRKFSRGCFVYLHFFSRKYFVGPRIFSWVFCRSPIFSPWFFVGPNLFSWIFGWHRLSLIREHLGGEWVDVDTSRKNVAFFN